MRYNDDDYSGNIINAYFNVLDCSFNIGVTEDQLREIFYLNKDEIIDRLRSSFEDSIRELAYEKGYLSMGVPEFFEIDAYEDLPPTKIKLV